MEIKNIRKGKGYYWKEEEAPTRAGSTRSSSGFTIDNLDTKTMDQATSKYEKLFILIRETLEDNDSLSMDDEQDRLTACQAIIDKMKSKRIYL